MNRLFEDADGLNWKDLFEKDSSRSLHNAIQQKYYITDQEFWERYKKYVDREIDEVVQIKRDFRRILWRFRELNSGKKDKGDFMVNIQKVVQDFYASEPKHNVSSLRDYFEEKQNMDNLLNQINGNETFEQAPSMDELAREVGELNTVAVLNTPQVFGSQHRLSLANQLIKSEPIDDKEALKIAGDIGRFGNKQILEFIWDSDGKDSEGHMKLTQRERELVLEVKQKFMEMLERKQEMDLTGRTARKVLSVKLMQAELFEVETAQDYSRRLAEVNDLGGNSVKLNDKMVRKSFEELKTMVYEGFKEHLEAFAGKWGLEISGEDELVSQLLGQIKSRLFFKSSKQHQLDSKANHMESRIKELGSDMMYEGEWQTKVVSFELITSFENFLFSMNRVFGNEQILTNVLSNLKSKKKSNQLNGTIQNLIKEEFKETTVKNYKIEEELKKSLEDESEDLIEESVYTKYKTKMENVVDQQIKEQESLDRKLFVFNFHVNQMKNDKSIVKLKSMLDIIKKDFANELEELKQAPETSEAKVRMNKIEEILSFSSTNPMGEDLMLVLKGYEDLSSKFVEREWYETYENWLVERERAVSSLSNSMDPSLKSRDELNKIQEIGVKKYLMEEIGLERYLGQEGYERVRQILGEEMEETQMTEAILKELVGESVEEEVTVGEVLEGLVEEATESSRQHQQSLGRELKLLNMKMKLVEEELKDLESMEQTKYFNKVIKVDREIQKIRESGREPSKKEMLRFISDWDLERKELYNADHQNDEFP